ncbi:RINT1-like protein [Cylas formicarius]|uniref:RINT1-like protein n=1 Tax=Cylas formicarius TaxID=197179 RepID=UPI0029583BE1|nr:RINT1-like protein [Cylas formicarius]
MDEKKRQICNALQVKHGSDLLDLEKCRNIYAELLERKSALQKELDVSNVEGSLGKAVSEIAQVLENSNKCVKHAKEIIQAIDNDLDEVEEARAGIKSQLLKLDVLQTTLQYMRIIQRVEYFCGELGREFSRKNDEQCVTVFVNLTEMGRALWDCRANHLMEYIKQTIEYWQNVLNDKLTKDFGDTLKLMKWPFISSNFALVVPFQSHVEKLQSVAEYLFQIELPAESGARSPVASGVLSHFDPVCVPVRLLVQPLRNRFLYHFYGNRQTNRPDKPEWYFTQVLTWIRDHKDVVDKWLQPVIYKLGLHHIDPKLEFTRGLVQLAVEKLYRELPSLQFDDFTFSHTVDEALGFDKELRETYGYPATQPGVLIVLTQSQAFVKWLKMEKKFAVEKMDAILAPKEAFDLLVADGDDLQVTACAEAFVTLLQTITERYENLPQPGHRLQFLELQLELLDDFRVRLLQLSNAEEGDVVESAVPMIANTAYYVESVLTDWGAALHYLGLHYYKKRSEAGPPASPPDISDLDDSPGFEAESVFSDTLSLYRHFRRDLLCVIVESVVGEVKSRSWQYRRERWSAMKIEKEFRSLSLTPSACPLFEVLAKRLHQLRKGLQARLFTQVWRNLAGQLDNYLFEDLVMDNRFNDGGALQLKFDVTRNLLPLFAQFSDKPANHFAKLADACTLLTLSRGSALLLRETLVALEGATGVEDIREKTLKEMGVVSFAPKMAVKVLNQRTDITIDRMVVD